MPARLLLPLSWLFAAAAWLRHILYRAGVLRSFRLAVPVVVVGNLIAGGAGKTPLTIWLAVELSRRGRRPGIISRGYGGKVQRCREVFDDDDALDVGDEALLMKRRTRVPVFVGGDRVEAGRALLAAYPDCDVVLSDDGLQHYRLARDFEIAVVDRRGMMNGWRLPAGPLREPARRLQSVDAVVANGWSGAAGFRMSLQGTSFHRLGDPPLAVTAAQLAPLALHAVAGIGEPARFFDQLRALGLEFECHAFADHHRYREGDFDFGGDAIVTTEKDAVKFGTLARVPVWVLPVTATVEPDLAKLVLETIDGSATA